MNDKLAVFLAFVYDYIKWTFSSDEKTKSEHIKSFKAKAAEWLQKA